jgi:hypothetical protein
MHTARLYGTAQKVKPTIQAAAASQQKVVQSRFKKNLLPLTIIINRGNNPKVNHPVIC